MQSEFTKEKQTAGRSTPLSSAGRRCQEKGGGSIPLASEEWELLSQEQAGPTSLHSAIRISTAASASPSTPCKTCPYPLTTTAPNQNSRCHLSSPHCLKYLFTPQPVNIFATKVSWFDTYK
jgi:hypothetical protein